MTIGDKLKEKVKGTKDKVVGTAEDVSEEDEVYEEGAPGTETGSKDDPLTGYREKEPMTPAKIKEHEPTAVKREMTENIAESGQIGASGEDAAEKARRSGMTKGTAGTAETGDESEQGAAETT